MRRVNTRGDRAGEQACNNGRPYVQFKETSKVHHQKSNSQISSSYQSPSKGHKKDYFWLIRWAYKLSKIYAGNFLIKARASLKCMY